MRHRSRYPRLRLVARAIVVLALSSAPIALAASTRQVSVESLIYDLKSPDAVRRQADAHLAAPWGVAIAPDDFGEFSGDLLVGNFSFLHSEINAFDLQTHQLEGTIPISAGSGHTPGGLWTLTFGGGGRDGSPNTLYFTDGIDGETHGLFGAITSVPLVDRL